MKFFPPPEFSSHNVARTMLLFVVVVLCGTVWGISDLSAQQLRVKTKTVGQATQFLRTDTSVAAQRSLSQSVNVWGYDLTGQRSGALRGHFALRYFNDFAFTGSERNNPYLSHEANRLSIDLATIGWRPVRGLDITFGRQLSRSIFFTRDFDGVDVRLKSHLDGDAFWTNSAYAGRHVIGRPDTLNPDQYDVQGRPIEERIDSSLEEWIVGVRSGVSVENSALTVAWERRGNRDYVAAERVGVSAVSTPWNQVNTSAYMSYHTVLRDLDRARFNIAARPIKSWQLSTGMEHVVPVFDSSSIFNLFGTSPSQNYFLSSMHQWKAHHFGGRIWLRTLHGDSQNFDFGSEPSDTNTIGFGLNHRVSIPIGARQLRLNSQASMQPPGSNSYGALQVIGSVQGELPIFDNSVRIRLRSSGVWVDDDPTTRRDGGGALTQLVGVDTDVSFGQLSFAAVGQTSDVLGSRINLFATFTTELWP